MKIFNYHFEGKGRQYQLKKYSQEQVQQPYENYLSASMSGNTSSQVPKTNVSKWKEVKVKKVYVSQGRVEKEKIKVETSPLNDYVSVPIIDETD
uniref:Uncharacterized protein n=1 Tax=Lactuca sativa TaxID=4236 RepID=A0A9R1V5N5_LACSA|nr:hypothetical protein LSAT_V11C600342230 [Lactuca sativa]